MTFLFCRTIKGLFLLGTVLLLCSGGATALLNGIVVPTNNAVQSAELPGNVSLALTDTFFQFAVPFALPVVNFLMRSLTIPPQKTLSFDLAELHITKFHIESATLTMRSPDTILLTGFNISAVVPKTAMVVKVGLIKCDGTVQASLSRINATLTMRLTRLSNGTLRVAADAKKMQWGMFDMKHTINGFACSAMESIIQAVLGELDKLIVSVIESELPKQVGPIIDSKANGALDAAPILFPQAPFISPKRMELYMVVVPPTKATKTTMASEQQKQTMRAASPSPSLAGFLGSAAKLNLFPDRDAAVDSTATAINNLLAYITSKGMLNHTVSFPPEYNTSLIEEAFPSLYKECPNCIVALTVGIMAPPFVEFRSEQTSVAHVPNAFIQLQMIPPNKTEAILIIGFSVSFVGGVSHVQITKDNLLLFKLMKVETLNMTLLISHIGPVHLDVLSREIVILLNTVLIPLFNSEFAGLRLPEFLLQSVVDITPNSIAAGTNVKPASPEVFFSDPL